MPVYDYALFSTPLTPAQRESVGWRRRQGLADANNQFHYFRLTSDDRILWGGYDAIHHFGSRVAPELDQRPATFDKLEAQFFRAFPQLDGLEFPYRWGGAIDTTTRFTVTFGQTMGDRVTYALGYTGLGVGASRWAGGVVRDLLLRPGEDRCGSDWSPARPSRSRQNRFAPSQWMWSARNSTGRIATRAVAGSSSRRWTRSGSASTPDAGTVVRGGPYRGRGPARRRRPVASHPRVRPRPVRTPSDPSTHVGDPFFWGAYPMAPWCNRLVAAPIALGGRTIDLPANFPDGTAIHGQVYDRSWHVDDGWMWIDGGGGDGWPWRYRVDLQVSVDGGHVGLDYALMNQDREAMPAGLGIHPWFRGPVDVAIHGDRVFPSNTGTIVDPEPPPRTTTAATSS